MSTISVTFNINNKHAEINYDGKIKKEKIEIVKINDFTEMATISWFFNENKKWVFSWKIWAGREQFFTFSQYDKKESNEDPWSDFSKWSFINNPQKGTVQTNKVLKMYDYAPCNLKINFEINDSPYGNWNSQHSVDG